MFLCIINRYYSLESYQNVLHILTCVVHYVKTFNNVNFLFDDQNKSVETVIKSIFKDPKNMRFINVKDQTEEDISSDINIVFVNSVEDFKNPDYYIEFFSINEIDSLKDYVKSKKTIFIIYSLSEVTGGQLSKFTEVKSLNSTNSNVYIPSGVFRILTNFSLSDQKSVDQMTGNFEIIKEIVDNNGI